MSADNDSSGAEQMIVEPNLRECSKPTVNRFVVLVEPTDAYLAWAKTCPGCDIEITLEELREGATAYLIPDRYDDPEVYIKRNYRRIFDWELASWYKDEAFWPKDRSYRVFKRFFDVRVCQIVVDLGKGPILRENP